MAAVGVSFVIRLWREYHKCPKCGETDPRKMRVKAESGNWIPWYLDGRDLVHCPDRWHEKVTRRQRC